MVENQGEKNHVCQLYIASVPAYVYVAFEMSVIKPLNYRLALCE